MSNQMIQNSDELFQNSNETRTKSIMVTKHYADDEVGDRILWNVNYHDDTFSIETDGNSNSRAVFFVSDIDNLINGLEMMREDMIKDGHIRKGDQFHFEEMKISTVEC